MNNYTGLLDMAMANRARNPIRMNCDVCRRDGAKWHLSVLLCDKCAGKQEAAVLLGNSPWCDVCDADGATKYGEDEGSIWLCDECATCPEGRMLLGKRQIRPRQRRRMGVRSRRPIMMPCLNVPGKYDGDDADVFGALVAANTYSYYVDSRD